MAEKNADAKEKKKPLSFEEEAAKYRAKWKKFDDNTEKMRQALHKRSAAGKQKKKLASTQSLFVKLLKQEGISFLDLDIFKVIQYITEHREDFLIESKKNKVEKNDEAKNIESVEKEKNINSNEQNNIEVQNNNAINAEENVIQNNESQQFDFPI